FCKQHNCDENSEEAKESFERFLSAAFFLYHTHPQAIYTSSKDLELNLDKLDIQKGFQTESSAQINKVAGLTEQLSLFTETEQNNMFSLPQTEQELRQQKSVRLAKKEK
ncbi:32634_t:CDS:2, partial [Racocetra persica]